MIVASIPGEICTAVDLMAAADRLYEAKGVRVERIYLLGERRQEIHDQLFRETYGKKPPRAVGRLDKLEIAGIDVREFEIIR